MVVRALLAAVVLAVVLTAEAGAGPNAACGRRVVDDWAADTRVDGAYSIACYRQAIKSLPEDLRAYSSAPVDIQRALQSRLASNPAANAATPAGDGKADRDALVRLLVVVTGIAVVGVFAAAVLR
jgi:hypothetical protein